MRSTFLITIHMPQRTSKIFYKQPIKKAFLFPIRVTSFARCTVWFGVTRSDQNTVKDYFTLSTITYFDWFLHHTRKEASFGVFFTHGVYQIFFTGFHFSLVTLNDHNPQFFITMSSQSAMNTMHCLTRIWFALVIRKIHFTLDDKFHFCGICIGVCKRLFPRQLAKLM